MRACRAAAVAGRIYVISGGPTPGDPAFQPGAPQAAARLRVDGSPQHPAWPSLVKFW